MASPVTRRLAERKGRIKFTKNSVNIADTAQDTKKAVDASSGIANRGGRFADLDAQKLDGEVGHHVPQNAYNKTQGRSRSDGPAVGMTKEDHAKTRTYGGKGKGTMKQDVGKNARQRFVGGLVGDWKLFIYFYTSFWHFRLLFFCVEENDDPNCEFARLFQKLSCNGY